MKQANSFMVFVGWCVAICAVCYGLYWGYNAIEESGYDRHKYEVEEELKAGNASVAELAAKTAELKAATDTIEQLNSQLELAKAEHAVLTPTFKTLVDLAGDYKECLAKDPTNGYRKCAYGPDWWTAHSVKVSASEIVVMAGKTYNARELAKYEFVRDAKGDIVDFKLVPAKQAAQY